MGIKKYKPVSPGLRTRVTNSFEEITTDKPEKSLLAKKSRTGGRNSSGRMTVRQRGGGHKKRYRIIDFKRNKDGIPGTIKTIEYDPNRSAFIALVFYADGDKRYILAPRGIKVGDTIMAGATATPDVGNTLFLKDIPLGSEIHNIEMHPGQGGAIVRSAGVYAVLTGKEGRYAIVKLPSGEMRRILITCKATMGKVGNQDHNLLVVGKAGANRWRGKRPHVRGVVMNPVDHPMGGGEGRASGGHPRSRTGIKAKGQKTRSRTKHSNKLIISKRKK